MTNPGLKRVQARIAKLQKRLTRHELPPRIDTIPAACEPMLKAAMGRKKPPLLDIRVFLAHPAWRARLRDAHKGPDFLDRLKEFECFCSTNGIRMNMNLYTLGLDKKAFDIVGKACGSQFPTMGHLRTLMGKIDRELRLEDAGCGKREIREIKQFYYRRAT